MRPAYRRGQRVGQGSRSKWRMHSFVRARKCVELGLHFNQILHTPPIQMHLTLFVAFMSPPCSSRVKTSSGDCTIWSGVFPASSTTIEASQGFELSQDCIALESESYCPMHVKGGGEGGSTGGVENKAAKAGTHEGNQDI